ncbi:MAG TPA: ABC transporter permease [Candidatus Acidoferrum sp.]|jgi:putative ABC transport system permease protein|nr:ABC transporter permease [Candidatus Acidoferrum sp.]
MHLHETFTVAIDALRANKLRAALTSLGVIIGSASIVLVVTVALTSKKFVISQIESVGANLVWVEVVKTPDKSQPMSHELTLQDMEAARSIPGVVQVAGTSDLLMSVVAEGRVRPVTLIGVTDGYQTIKRLVVVRGRYFDATDMASRGKVCLITAKLAEKLYGHESSVGQQLRMGELTFTVIGVFKERVETYGLSDIQDESVLIPFGLMKSYTGADVLRVLDAQAGSSEEVERVQKQVGALLRGRHPPEAEYNVQTLTAILVAAQNISLALTIVLIVIAFIALLISGIGIMNIMLVTVKERTREIGIRKAIGAPRRDILYQFLVEAFLISGGGAVLGILIGLAVPVAAQFFLPGNLRVPISPLSVVVAFVVSCSTGLFFGYLPANNASSLQPIESLRYE